MTHAVVQWSGTTIPSEYTVADSQHLLLVEEAFGGPASERTTTLTVGRDAHVVYCYNCVTQTSQRRTFRLVLAAGARMEFFGILLGRGDGHIRLRVTQEHATGASWGRTSLCAVLDDRSELDVAGSILIRAEANQSDALLEGRVLLLGPEARADVVPSLEIQARDVKATHAAAIGPMDEEQRWYLMARGIPPDEAGGLIKNGFLDSLIGRIPVAETRDALRARWLHHLAS